MNRIVWFKKLSNNETKCYTVNFSQALFVMMDMDTGMEFLKNRGVDMDMDRCPSNSDEKLIIHEIF